MDKTVKILLCIVVLLLLVVGAMLAFMYFGRSATPTWAEQYNLGVRYLEEGHYEQAILAFSAAIEIDPNRPESYAARAEAYYALGNYDAARRDYDTALAIDPQNTSLRQRLETLFPTESETQVPPEPLAELSVPVEFFCITNTRSSWEITLQSDGSFSGTFRLYDWGDNTPEYPNGTCYITQVTGSFRDIRQLDDFSYTMTAEEVRFTESPEQTYISENTRFIVEQTDVIRDGDSYELYLPGVPRARLPQGLVNAVQNSGIYSMENIHADAFVLYNDTGIVYVGEVSDGEATGGQEERTVDIASTLGFEKAWEISEEYEGQQMVTALAFFEDGTFCCAVGYYLSEWTLAFQGTYQTEGAQIGLRYVLNGEEERVSYQLDWDNRTLVQTSEENIVFPHPAGTRHQLEESPWFTADALLEQVEIFLRYFG